MNENEPRLGWKPMKPQRTRHALRVTGAGWGGWRMHAGIVEFGKKFDVNIKRALRGNGYSSATYKRKL
jgi:hypothetical protein